LTEISDRKKVVSGCKALLRFGSAFTILVTSNKTTQHLAYHPW